jgi:hypothetical protein
MFETEMIGGDKTPIFRADSLMSQPDPAMVPLIGAFDVLACARNRHDEHRTSNSA